MPTESLNQRAQRILKLLIERYIQEGTPIGSKTLAEADGGSVSPATIRNILADLETQGYLSSPHTSAGRIPTSRGLRLFVDGLIDRKPIAPSHIELLSQHLHRDANIDSLLDSASTLLSNMTHLIGLVSLPKQEQVKLRHVEFLPLSEQRVLVILVLNEREVQNRIIVTERQYQANELQTASNFLNEHFAGKQLKIVYNELVLELQHDKQQMDNIMQTVIDVAAKVFVDEQQQNDYVINGHSNLFNMVHESELTGLTSLFNAFTQKQSVLHLLEHCIKADGVQIFIGEETGYEVFDDCSIVTSNYAVDGENIGVVGVVGPQRMNYANVIPAVDITAKLLGAALSCSD